MFERIIVRKSEILKAFIEAGGVGSGHHGHSGIPGHRGGSLPGEGGGGGKSKGRRARMMPLRERDLKTHQEDHRTLRSELERDLLPETLPDDPWGSSGAVAKIMKQHVETSLQDRLDKLSPEDREAYDYMCLKMITGTPTEAFSNERTLIAAWADSSFDHNELSVLMQLAAKEQFDLKDAGLTHASERAIEEVKEKILAPGGDEIMKGAKIFLREMYDSTQEFFKSQGIKEVVLFRGANVTPTQLPGGTDKWKELVPYTAMSRIDEVQTQPLNAWSTDLNQAKVFVGDNTSPGSMKISMLLAARVPVERILSTTRTGYGCHDEGEMVVLGGIDTSHVIYTDSPLIVKDTRAPVEQMLLNPGSTLKIKATEYSSVLDLTLPEKGKS